MGDPELSNKFKFIRQFQRAFRGYANRFIATQRASARHYNPYRITVCLISPRLEFLKLFVEKKALGWFWYLTDAISMLNSVYVCPSYKSFSDNLNSNSKTHYSCLLKELHLFL